MSIPTSHQHAPSPDYSISEYEYPAGAHSVNLGSYDTAALTVRYCLGCDDLCLTAGNDKKCDACLQYDADELAAAKRAALTRALLTIERRPDYHDIMCRECGEETGLTYNGYADALDGMEATCAACLTPGVVVVDSDDEGHASIYFRGAP